MNDKQQYKLFSYEYSICYMEINLRVCECEVVGCSIRIRAAALDSYL